MTEVITNSAESMRDQDKIPLIIKKYQKGELTPKLLG